MNNDPLIRKFRHAFILASLLLCASVPARAQVPENAGWAIHVDIVALKESPLGQLLAEQETEEKHQKGLDWLKQNFDFDLEEDLDAMTIYGSGKKRHAITHFSGRFNIEKSAEGLAGMPGYATLEVDGQRVHKIPVYKKRAKFVCYPDENNAFITHDEASMQSALAVHNGSLASAPIDKTDQPDAILVGYFDIAAIAKVNPRASMLAAVKYADMVVYPDGDQTNASIIWDATSEQAADDIVALFNGLMSWARIKNADNAELMNWINESVKIGRVDNSVEIHFHANNQELVEKMESCRMSCRK